MQGLSSILSLFRSEFNMLDSIDNLTFIKLRILARNAIFSIDAKFRWPGRHYITLLSMKTTICKHTVACEF